MDNVKLFIWNPTIDHLQYFTWLALRSIVRTPITFIIGRFENKDRKVQEWKSVDLQELDPVVIPPNKLWGEGLKLLKANPEAIHIFQAFRGAEGYNYFPLILFALRMGIKVVVLDEAYTTSPVGLLHDENSFLALFKTWVRPVSRNFMSKVLNAISSSQKPCIMPLSLIAKDQFIQAGFVRDTLFPFGYFVPRQPNNNKNSLPSSSLRLVFVGALIFRKGVDLLVEVVRELVIKGYEITLDIYGSGNFNKFNTSDLPIRYHGTVPFDQIQAVIAEYDMLILPSRHDGWGVVVNEALLQGVPVIVSNRVGSKCLIESTGAGLVFESENVGDIETKIKMVIENPSFLMKLKMNAQKVGEELLPEKAAQYFLDTLLYYFFKTGFPPSSIWNNDLSQEKSSIVYIE